MPIDRSGWRVVAIWCGVASLLALPALIAPTMPPPDVSAYYGPMIRAFAAGDWEHAYYRMIPPLSPTLAGVLCRYSGLSPFHSAQVAASLFFVATLPLAYMLTRLLWNERLAMIGIALLACCSRLVQYAGEGLIDTGKLFFLTVLALSLLLYHRERSWRATGGVLLAAVGLTLVRGEGFLVAATGLGVLALLELVAWRRRLGRVPYRFALCGLLTVVACLPWMRYEYHQTGYYVTDSRQLGTVKAIQNLLSPPAPADDATAPPAAPSPPPAATEPPPRPTLGDRVKYWIDFILVETLQGLYLPYLPLLLAGAWLLYRRRQWTGPQLALMAGFWLHVIMLIVLLDGWINKRYVIVGLPMIIGVCAYAVDAAYTWLQARQSPARARRTVRLIVALFMIGTAGHCLLRALPETDPAKRERIALTREVAAWIAAESPAIAAADPVHLHSDREVYYNGQPVVVVTARPQIAFLADCELAPPSPHLVARHGAGAVDAFHAYCDEVQAHFVVYERTLEKRLALDENEPLPMPGYTLVYSADPVYPRNYFQIYRRQSAPMANTGSTDE